MTIERALLAKSAQATAAAVYIEDVFSSWLRTGTGASSTVTNNIDIQTNGGLVITKSRSAATSWRFTDKSRGATYSLDSSSTASQATDANGLTAFTTSGYTVGSDTNYNNTGATYVDFAFRKQPKFFDVVTYTGTGSARTIAHSLGATPGMIIVKGTSASNSWTVYHKSLNIASGGSLYLNATAAQDLDPTNWNSTAPTSTVFSLGSGATNTNGVSYIAYLFADSNSGGFGPAGTDSVVACGSFTTDASLGEATVNLGWEPQFLILKNSQTAGYDWVMADNMRGIATVATSNMASLLANTSGAETTASYVQLTSTGFKINGGFGGSQNGIYLAIRRGPMKTPTDATKVFAPIASSAASATKLTTGFPVDTQITSIRTGNALNSRFVDRLRGASSTTTQSGNYLVSSTTAAEVNSTTNFALEWDNTGFKKSSMDGGENSIFWNFARAPGFFDVVCYTGTGTIRTQVHGLTVTPELLIIRNRTALDNWAVYHPAIGNTKQIGLNYSNAASNSDRWNNTSPTASVFSLGINNEINALGKGYVAYLFATCPGVQYINSYVGDGTTGRVINCGFASGARFVCIKATSTTGSWWVFDSARGIVSAADPALQLNSTAAEVTSADAIDPASSGFIVNQEATCSLNASGVTYLVWAIA